jgi:hypothetical protein
MIAALYNSDPVVLGQRYPPVLAIHTDVNKEGTGGTLLRVLELYLTVTDGSGIGDAMGMAATTSRVLVAHDANGGSSGAVTAFSLAEVRQQAMQYALGVSGQLIAMASKGVPDSFAVDVRPRGGISFYRHDTTCVLVVSAGSVSEDSSTVVYRLDGSTEWVADAAAPPAPLTTFTTGANVTGLVVVYHKVDGNTYAAINRCVAMKGYDCRVEFVKMNVQSPQWSANVSNVVYSLAVPAGSVGLTFDPANEQFVFGCSGAASANIRKVSPTGWCTPIPANAVCGVRVWRSRRPIIPTGAMPRNPL